MRYVTLPVGYKNLASIIMATSGTEKQLAQNGITVRRISGVLEGRPHCVDAIKSGDVQLIINTTGERRQSLTVLKSDNRP